MIKSNLLILSMRKLKPREAIRVPYSSQVNDKDRSRIQDSWSHPNSSKIFVLKFTQHPDKETSSSSLVQGSDWDLSSNSSTAWLYNPEQVTDFSEAFPSSLPFPEFPSLSLPTLPGGSTDEKSLSSPGKVSASHKPLPTGHRVFAPENPHPGTWP